MPETVNNNRRPTRRRIILCTLIMVTALFGGWLYTAKTQRDVNRKLLGAVRKGDVAAVKLLLAHGANPNIRDMPLEQLTLWQQISLLFHRDTQPPGDPKHTLIELALEVDNDEDSDSKIATDSKSMPLVKALLDAGAHPDESSAGHKTPLMEAASVARLKTVQTLLDHGANPQAHDDEGQIPLHYIAGIVSTGDELKIATLLLKLGNEVNAADNKGMTPLMYSVVSWRGPVAMLKILIAHGAQINARSKEGYSALLIAAAASNPQAVKILLEHGAEVNVRSDDGFSALILAAGKVPGTKDIRSLMLLLEHGAEVNVYSSRNISPLHCVSNDGPLPAVEALLAHRAKVDPVSDNGDTPLTISLKRKNRPDIAKLLIEHGADVNHRNNAGETALSLATKHNYQETVLLLRAAGAKQ